MWQLTILAISVTAFGGLGWWLSPCAEVQIRYIGLGFELAGIATVALGLLDRHGLFGIPFPLLAAWHWLEQWWRPRRHIVAADAGMIRATGAAIGRLTFRLGPDATVEQRVARLETNLDALGTQLGQHSTALAEESAKREQELAEERRARIEENNLLENRLQQLGAGNLNLEWVGIIFLVLGVMLTTTSSEIARYFTECTPTIAGPAGTVGLTSALLPAGAGVFAGGAPAYAPALSVSIATGIATGGVHLFPTSSAQSDLD